MNPHDRTELTIAPAPPDSQEPLDDVEPERDSASHTRQTAAITAVDYALEPGARLGDYQIETVIGQGGMGIVYLGVHPLIGKRVAIKVLKKEMCADPQAVRRFIDEASVVNEIGHPNIVDIFAFGDMPDGRSYLVMELLRGETMRARMASKALDLVEMAAVLKPLARALEAAHEKGIIHRDLKPDNVFLVDVRGEGPTIKLLDFGIAKLARRDSTVERTATGTMMGTPQYIAPEQARGYAIDHRVDIYSLGCIAFEVLTGRCPFVADNAMDMVAKHLLEPAPRPSSLVPEVPPELDDLVVAMMCKDATGRPGLAELIALLDRIGAGGPRVASTVVPLRALMTPATPRPVVGGHLALDATVAMTNAPGVVAAPAASTGARPVEYGAASDGPRGAKRWIVAALLALACGAVAFVVVENTLSVPAPAAVHEAPVATPPPPTPTPEPTHAVTAPPQMAAPPPPPPPPVIPAIVLPPPTPTPVVVTPPIQRKLPPHTVKKPDPIAVPKDPNALIME